MIPTENPGRMAATRTKTHENGQLGLASFGKWAASKRRNPKNEQQLIWTSFRKSKTWAATKTAKFEIKRLGSTSLRRWSTIEVW